MTQPARKFVLPAVVAACTLAVCPARTAFAQLGVSARLEGMHPALRGLVDDPISDAAFNPARVAGVEGRQLYIGRRVYDVDAVALPVWQTFYPRYSTLRIESIGELDRTVSNGDRFELTWFTPFAGDTRASFSADVASYGYDDVDASRSVSRTSHFVSNELSTEEKVDAGKVEHFGVTLDAAVSSARSADVDAFGVRVRAKYVNVDDRYSHTLDELSMPIDSPDELAARYSLDKTHEDYEQWYGAVTAGWFRPQGALREASVTGGATTVSRTLASAVQEIYDEDVDGNGEDPRGTYPQYSFGLGNGASMRDLSGGNATARLVFAHGARWRTRWSGGVSMLQGDGRSTVDANDIDRYSANDDVSLKQMAAYTYDTEVTSYFAIGAASYSADVAADVLVATVAQVTYNDDDYDERGGGTAAIEYSNAGATTTYDAPYAHRLSYTSRRVNLIMATALEWTLPKYLTFRFGAWLKGERRDDESKVGRTVDVAAEQFASAGLVTEADRDISWRTSTGYRVGVEVRLRDRVWLDMYTTGLYFTDFSYATLRLAL